MFMDKQELSYSLKFIKGEVSRSKKGYIVATVVLFASYFVNMFITLADMFFTQTESIQIYTFQNISQSIVAAFVVLSVCIYVFCSKKIDTANIIFPQTCNTRFVKNFFIGFFFLINLCTAYIIYYFLQYGIAYLLSATIDKLYVVSQIDIKSLGVVTLSFLMYGLFTIAIFMFIGACIKKFKAYCLIVPFIIAVLLSTNFMQTVMMLANCGKFYFTESNLGAFVVKILVTTFVLLAVAYVINNTTPFENNVKYSKWIITIAVFLTFLIAVFATFNLINTNMSLTNSTLEQDIYQEKMEEITIDVSHLEKGSKIKLSTIGLTDGGTGYSSAMHYGNENEDIIIEGDTLTINYRYLRCEDDVSFNISDYANESFNVYLDGDTLYMEYDAEKNVKLLKIAQSFLELQFSKSDMSYFNTSFPYIIDAYCYVSFE